jgi:uncharacterized membrane protein
VNKTLTAFGVVALFAVGFLLLGMFVDIQVILKYDYTPISFTFTFLLVGVLVGVLLAFKMSKRNNSLTPLSKKIA